MLNTPPCVLAVQNVPYDIFVLCIGVIRCQIVNINQSKCDVPVSFIVIDDRNRKEEGEMSLCVL